MGVNRKLKIIFFFKLGCLPLYSLIILEMVKTLNRWGYKVEPEKFGLERLAMCFRALAEAVTLTVKAKKLILRK